MATFQGNRFEELNLLSQFEPNLNLNDFDFNSTSLANKFSSSSSSTPDTTSSWLLNSFNFFFISTLSKHKGIESICRNQEGWGPTSSQRDFDFTPCFQEISLWIAPVALLAIFGAIQLAIFANQSNRTLSPLSRIIFHSKQAVLSILILSSALNLSFLYSSLKHPFSDLHFYTTLILLLGYALSLPLQNFNHQRSRRASTLLIFFWLSQIIATLLTLRNKLEKPSPPIKDNLVEFVLFSIRGVLVLGLFGLECCGIEIGMGGKSVALPLDDEEDEDSGLNASNLRGRRPNKLNGHSHRNSSSLSNGLGSSFSNASQTEGGEGKEALGPAKECPVVTANIWSRISFSWMQPLMTLGSKKFLTEEDMWSLPPNEDAEALGKRFQANWEKTRSKKTGKPKLWTTLAYSYGGPFFLAAVYKAIQDTLAFVQPQLLRMLLQFVQNWDDDPNHKAIQGFTLSLGLFIVAITQTAFLHQYFQLAFTTGMRVRAGLVSAIYKKALRTGNEQSKESTGQIVNYMSVDATRLQDLCTYGHIVWSALFQMTLAFVSLYVLLGWQAFVGVGIMVVSIPLNTFLARTLKKLSEKQMKVKDRRTRLMNEILSNIKSIKLFAWEEAFTAKLYNVRNNEELKLLRTVGAISSVFQFFWTAIPFLVSLATFTTYALTSDQPLTPDIIFPALSLFSLLQFPIAMLASIISAVIQAGVSAKRICDFLDSGELDENARKVILSQEDINSDPLAARDENATANAGPSPQVGDEIITIKNGEFKWTRNQPVPTLQDINLSVKKGELLAVLGKVGDGKSSLLSSILGELYRSDGSVTVRGRVAYFSQGGWAMGTSIRENITFGLKFEPEFYQKVLDACALGPDLEILPQGDQTEVGERGVSLSGGQRARVALARAVYARADVYLLDDPLAAVDAHVGAHIFKNVIGPEGLLKNKARILTLNSVSVLPSCQQIISVRRGIILDERGSYDEVMAKRGDLYNLITGLGKQSEKSKNDEEHDSPPTPPDAEVVDYDLQMSRQGQAGEETIRETKLHRRLSSISIRPKALTRRQVKAETLRQLRETSTPAETRATGAVSKDVYKKYVTSASLIGVFIYLFFHLAAQVTQVSRDVVLKQWGASNTDGGDVNAIARHYLTLYAIVGLTSSVMVCIAPLILSVWLVISSAKKFHDGMFDSVLRSPLQYFETIPTGRLLNLFSRDVNVIDEVLPRTLQSAVRTGTVVLGVLAVVSYSVPPFIIIIFPLAIGYYFILRYYLATSRELKRLDATTKSPIFQFFSETLGGLPVIRAFGQQSRFIATNEARVDRNQQCYLPSVTANRWLAVRIELVGSIIIFLASTLAVALKTRDGGQMDAGLLGLMMSQTLSTTQSLNWVVRSASDVEQNIVSVERVISYSDLKPEKPYEIEETKPKESWPSKGTIEFKNYSTRYRPELDLVLKDLNIKIEDGERIGVVGRTGAGKSSLTLALFRIIEADKGSIVIDGIDTSKIGLKSLRRALAIIPQDPQLWEGTLRDNLDPTGNSDDAALWKALDSAHLREHVNSLEGRLDAHLTEGGQNWSAGQRQLICIARAFLRNAKLLILDEATSAIDLETDSKLQAIVRSEFKGTTLTVAHRLNTILDSSRVLVLSNGAVAEFDTPSNLLANKESIFYSMASEAGLVKE